MSDRHTPETDALVEKLIPIAEKITEFNAQSIIKQLLTEILTKTTKLERERDEAREEWGRASMDAAQLLSEKTKAIAERDELREEIRDWKRLHDAAERGVDLTIAEGTISDLLKQRDECAAMCGRYKQERDIAEEDATNYHARIIELIAERDKTKQERDEAREVSGALADIAFKHLTSLLASTPHSKDAAHEEETQGVIAAIKRWKELKR